MHPDVGWLQLIHGDLRAIIYLQVIGLALFAYSLFRKSRKE